MTKISEALGRRLHVRERSHDARSFAVGSLIPRSGAMGMLGPCAYGLWFNSPDPLSYCAPMS